MEKILRLYFLSLLYINSSLAQSTTAESRYLAQNSATWNGEFKNISRVFTSELLKNQLVLIGESHGIKSSHEIEADLIVYLKKQTGFKYLLIEMGYLDGMLLNNFIRSGKVDDLDAFFAAHKGTYYWNKSVRDFYTRLYDLNKSLPDNQKIILLPVDLEFGHRAAIKYLQEKVFVGNAAATPAGKQIVKIDVAKGAGKDIMTAYQQLYTEFSAAPSTYKTVLTKNFEDVHFLMRNLHERFAIAANNNFNTRRDSVMYENFNVYKKRYGFNNEKLVGIFGSFHIKQTDKPEDISFAALLKKDSAIRGITSVLLTYEGGRVMQPKYGSAAEIDTAKTLYRSVPNHFDYIREGIYDGDLLLPFIKTDKGVLFNLAASDSPFKGKKSFLMEYDNFATTDKMFQVLILLNASPATEPLEGEMEVK